MVIFGELLMTEKSIRRHKSGRLYWEISWNEPQSHNDLREQRDGHVQMKSLSLLHPPALCSYLCCRWFRDHNLYPLKEVVVSVCRPWVTHWERHMSSHYISWTCKSWDMMLLMRSGRCLQPITSHLEGFETLWKIQMYFHNTSVRLMLL